MKVLKIFFILSVFLMTDLATAEKKSYAHKMCENLSRMVIHSHRGASDRPENMITAFQRAVVLGADFVEMDLQISKDDKIVVAHDAYLKAECFGKDRQNRDERIYFRDLTLEQIKKFDCGSHVLSGVAVPNERISTLQEVMEALEHRRTFKGLPLKLNIEIKYNPSQPQFYPPREFYVRKILEVLDESEYDPSRLVVQSFDVGVLLEIRKQEGAFHRTPLRLSSLLSNGKRGVEIAKSLNSDLITPHFGQVNKEMLEDCHRNGIQVIPWTLNHMEEIVPMIEMGVDGAITDHPDLFVDLMDRYCKT